METENELILRNLHEVVKVTSLIEKGLFEQTRYYAEKREIAGELHDRKGVLLHRFGAIPDAVVKEYYGDGAVKRAVTFKGGMAHGRGIDYYPSGEMFEENMFRRGRLHGICKTYRRDGLLWIEATYKNGKLHGNFTSYHDNGNTETKGQYQKGKLDGPYAAYDRYGGLLEEGLFKHGKKQGIHRSYHETGHIARSATYDDGELVAIEEFDEEGRMVGVSGSDKKYCELEQTTKVGK